MHGPAAGPHAGLPATSHATWPAELALALGRRADDPEVA